MIKLNIYRHAFSVRCPNDGEIIAYKLELKTDRIVMVEEIKSFTSLFSSDFHERIADALHGHFGGEQKITAFHQDVEVETLRIDE